MSTPNLRVVSPDDPPRPAPTITEALDGGPRDVLAAMRLALAKKLDAGEVSSNAIASAYKELRELDRQIRAIDSAAKQEEQRRADRPRRSFNASTL